MEIKEVFAFLQQNGELLRGKKDTLHQPIYLIKLPVFCREKQQRKNSSCPTVASEQQRDTAVPSCPEGTLFCPGCSARRIARFS